ncbi:MAG: sensor histidine kinase [Meiothermus sp.]|uniref:sensor histidine kinase n=1 Tax=Meiothermus sp. TaxID=1955249 RepID=UPI0025F2C014|nr:sensor histidine kinase [Meiothermus sp.]MCS7068004.1 sensor histidine kinase [Meiothermus sp.]MCX7601328.1 sensor histidine kinase [Meiothermus sp.]MDW8424394.1 sensor histidine kinase [Meiothermus sp.]
MSRAFKRFFAGRPVAKVVVLLTALNLLTVLIFTLLVPARPLEVPLVLPWQDPAQTAGRLGAALALFVVVLWAVRPGQRRAWEFGVLVAIGVGVVAWLSQNYLPFLALGLIPVVARYWLPLWVVLLVVAGLGGLSVWWAQREPLQITFEILLSQGPQGNTAWSALPTPAEYPNLSLAFFIFIAFLYSGYALFTLELLIRETRAREELERTRRELEQTSRQAGVLEERQRLAREIHDTLAQGFASIVVQLEAAETAQSPASAARHLEQARSAAREGLSEARRMVWALRPEILENTSLPEALGRLLQRWQEESGVRAQFTLTGEPRPLHPELEVGLLRIAQEALANIRKHSRARQATLTLSYLSDMVLMDVQDDGVGLQPPTSGSFGLRSMRERVEALGGQMTVESEPGQGTTLAFSLPLYRVEWARMETS